MLERSGIAGPPLQPARVGRLHRTVHNLVAGKVHDQVAPAVGLEYGHVAWHIVEEFVGYDQPARGGTLDPRVTSPPTRTHRPVLGAPAGPASRAPENRQ